MVGQDNVTFRFRIDSAKAEQAITKLEALVRKLGGAADQTSGKMKNFSTATNQMGTNAAASAVNFQTATQGALNLSTAIVQTYTSISNLDRANNRAKMSIIAVARAEDLLANKIERQNALREAGLGGSQKYVNITKEIATAEADLTVKIEKKGIEQAAVNDIYMLFATNIANVSISSLQTMGVLLGQERMARLAAAAATKLHGYATWEAVRANRAATWSMTGLKIGLGGSRVGWTLSTIAVKLHTFALKALKVALGPIGLIFIGISAAMAAYESNLGGIKDTINGLLGIKDDFEESLLAERAATQGLTDDNEKLLGTYKKLIPAHEKYVKMMRDAAANLGDQRLAAQYQAQLIQPKSGFSTPSVTGGQQTVAKATLATSAHTAVAAGAVSSGGTIPTTTSTPNIVTPTSAITPNPTVEDATPIPFGTILQREMYKKLTPPQKFEALMAGFVNTGDKRYVRYAEDIRYEAESWRSQGIETDQAKAFKEIATKNATMSIADKSILSTNTDTHRWIARQINASGSKSITGGASQMISASSSIGVGGAYFMDALGKYDTSRTPYSGSRTISYNGVGGLAIAKSILAGTGTFGHEGNMIDTLRQIQMDATIPSQRGLARQGFYTDQQGVHHAINDPNIAHSRQLQTFIQNNLRRDPSAGGLGPLAGYTTAGQQWNGTAPGWAIAEGKARMSFANGVGRIYANIVNSLISIGGTGRIGRSAASARRHLQKDRKFIANAGYIHTAKLYGFTQNEDFMARLEEGVVSTNGDIAQSRSNFNVAAELAQEFIEFQFSMLKSIGIDSRSASAIAKEIGMDSPLAIDAGFLQNAALVAQMNQSDFDNTNIIHESKTKLNMSNQEVFAIRFNGKRGDEELLDRIRFQDRLEAMSSGTSAF